MTIILVQNSRREVKMPVHNLCFRVSCGSFLTTFLSFMTQRANFAFKTRTQVVTPRNRLEVLLFVFMASYLLCCGDVELNPGPTGNETDTQTSQDPQEEAPKTKRYETRVDLQTVSTEIPVRATSTDIEQDMGARILEAIQQPNENFQSLQTSMNLMRDDIGAVKTDINHVRLKCEEIGSRCDRMEKKQSELSSKLQENRNDIDELFDSQENTKNETEKTTSTVQRVEDEMTKLKAEVERLEEFSRRDNLRMYGITSQEGLEPRGLRHLCPGSDRRSQQRGGTQEMDDGRHCPSTPNRPKSGRTAKAHDRQVQPLERQNDCPI